MTIIGLTGGFGTGKSTVAAFFRKRGAVVIDADALAHETLLKKVTRLPGHQITCYKRIVKVFGNRILNKNREIDRKKLAAIVFADKKLLNKLNGIVHPHVIRRMKGEVKKIRRADKNAVVVLDIPLLIEAGLEGLADKIVVVKAGLRQQLERCRKSLGLSEAKALARIKAQMPLRKKIRLADFVIDNSGSKERTKGEVRRIWERIRRPTIRKRRT
jgi:dephospho-CoA kinase